MMMTLSPMSMLGVKVGKCLPRRCSATMEARRPTTRLVRREDPSSRIGVQNGHSARFLQRSGDSGSVETVLCRTTSKIDTSVPVTSPAPPVAYERFQNTYPPPVEPEYSASSPHRSEI